MLTKYSPAWRNSFPNEDAYMKQYKQLYEQLSKSNAKARLIVQGTDVKIASFGDKFKNFFRRCLGGENRMRKERVDYAVLKFIDYGLEHNYIQLKKPDALKEMLDGLAKPEEKADEKKGKKAKKAKKATIPHARAKQILQLVGEQASSSALVGEQAPSSSALVGEQAPSSSAVDKKVQTSLRSAIKRFFSYNQAKLGGKGLAKASGKEPKNINLKENISKKNQLFRLNQLRQSIFDQSVSNVGNNVENNVENNVGQEDLKTQLFQKQTELLALKEVQNDLDATKTAFEGDEKSASSAYLDEVEFLLEDVARKISVLGEEIGKLHEAIADVEKLEVFEPEKQDPKIVKNMKTVLREYVDQTLSEKVFTFAKWLIGKKKNTKEIEKHFAQTMQELQDLEKDSDDYTAAKELIPEFAENYLKCVIQNGNNEDILRVHREIEGQLGSNLFDRPKEVEMLLCLKAGEKAGTDQDKYKKFLKAATLGRQGAQKFCLHIDNKMVSEKSIEQAKTEEIDKLRRDVSLLTEADDYAVKHSLQKSKSIRSKRINYMIAACYKETNETTLIKSLQWLTANVKEKKIKLELFNLLDYVRDIGTITIPNNKDYLVGCLKTLINNLKVEETETFTTEQLEKLAEIVGEYGDSEFKRIGESTGWNVLKYLTQKATSPHAVNASFFFQVYWTTQSRAKGSQNPTPDLLETNDYDIKMIQALSVSKGKLSDLKAQLFRISSYLGSRDPFEQAKALASCLSEDRYKRLADEAPDYIKHVIAEAAAAEQQLRIENGEEVSNMTALKDGLIMFFSSLSSSGEGENTGLPAIEDHTHGSG